MKWNSWSRQELKFNRKELEFRKGYQEFRKRGKNVLERNQKLSIEEQKASGLWVRAGPGYFWGSFQLVSWVLRDLAPS